MAISDAQFSAWLAGDNPREWLYEQKFAYESGGAPVEGTRYFSVRGYGTGASDSPANQRYIGRISALPRFEVSVPADGLGGMTEVSVGEVRFDNHDGVLDDLLDNIIEGREGTWLLGAPAGTPGWSRSDFRTVLVTVAEVAYAPDSKTMVIDLRDHRLLLDKGIVGDTVDDYGTKPLVFTFDAAACSIEPVLKSDTDLTYYVLQNYANSYITQVRDNGGSLITGNSGINGTDATITANAATDTISNAGHPFVDDDVFSATDATSIFAGLSLTEYWVINSVAGTSFQLSTTKGGSAVDITGTTFTGSQTFRQQRVYTKGVTVDGTIQLSSAPAGRLTVDVRGYSASQNTSTTSGGPGELMRALLVDYGGIDAGDIDATSFQTLGNTYGYLNQRQSTARAVIARENLLDVLEDIARVMQIWWGPDHLGVFYAGRFNLSGLSAATATRTLGGAGGAPLLTDPRVENLRDIIGRICLKTERNYRPLTYGEMITTVTDDPDLATTLAAEFRSVREPSPTGTSYADNWQGFFKTASRLEIGGAFSQGNLDILNMWTEILDDQEPHIQVIEVETDLRAYAWRLGDVVELTYPRYTFASGQNCRVIGKAPDFDRERVQLRLITKTTPDYTTASYP